jgi:hypothetical protein
MTPETPPLELDLASVDWPEPPTQRRSEEARELLRRERRRSGVFRVRVVRRG